MSWDIKIDHDDPQRHELYRAERSVDWKKYGGTETLEELEDVWLYVNRLMNRVNFEKRYPRTHSLKAADKKKYKPSRQRPYGRNVYVIGENRNGGKRGLRINPGSGACANRDGMWLSKWGRQKWIIIHELAHVIDHIENGLPRHAWHTGHGWQFAAIYINLTRMAFGTDCKRELKQAFRDGSVRYLQPRGARNQCPWDPDPDRQWVT